jgi:type I restriction enzyme S subunit
MKSWPTKLLGELVNFVGGGTPRRDRPDYWGGEIPWASVKDLQSQSLETTLESITADGLANSASNLIPKGTVIIASRVGLGKVAINRKPVAINQDLKALTPRSDNLLPRYLLFFLLLKADYFERTGVGATVKGLTLADYQKLNIVLPPVVEQERIVKLLDGADELRKLRAQADRRTTDLIPALFHEMFDNSDSRNWKEHSFGDSEILEIIDGDRGTNYPKKFDFREEGYCLFLNTSNVRKGAFDFSKCDFVTREKDAALRKGKLTRGDVILTTRGTLGNSAHYHRAIAHENVRINSGMVILRTKPTLLLPEFLLVILNSDEFANQVSTMTSGSAQPQLPINRLAHIKFALPPLPLQKKFTQRVTEIRELEASQATSRTRLDALFQSMLHRAFNGEL